MALGKSARLMLCSQDLKPSLSSLDNWGLAKASA